MNSLIQLTLIVKSPSHPRDRCRVWQFSVVFFVSVVASCRAELVSIMSEKKVSTLTRLRKENFPPESLWSKKKTREEKSLNFTPRSKNTVPSNPKNSCWVFFYFYFFLSHRRTDFRVKKNAFFLMVELFGERRVVVEWERRQIEKKKSKQETQKIKRKLWSCSLKANFLMKLHREKWSIVCTKRRHQSIGTALCVTAVCWLWDFHSAASEFFTLENSKKKVSAVLLPPSAVIMMLKSI